MEAVKQDPRRQGHRGRPRGHEPATGLVRRNLLVDPVALQKLCELYGMTSQSEAVRRAIDLILLGEQAHSIQQYFAAHGAPEDVFGPPPPLPVYLGPDDVVDLDDEDYP